MLTAEDAEIAEDEMDEEDSRPMRATELNRISEGIIRSAIEVHRFLGPGLLESAYEECLAYQLAEDGFSARRQVPVPVVYKGVKLECGYRLDLLVSESVIVEIKSVAGLERIHEAQVLSCLRLSGHHLGLLMNFNSERLVDGLKRLVWRFPK